MGKLQFDKPSYIRTTLVVNSVLIFICIVVETKSIYWSLKVLEGIGLFCLSQMSYHFFTN